MQVGFATLAAIAGVAVYTVLLALIFGKLKWSWRVALALALVATVGVGPFAGLRSHQAYTAALDRAVVNALAQEHQAAIDAFNEQYPSAELGSASLVWLYQYTNQGQPHVVIRVGNQWVELNLQTPEPTPTPEGQE